jgi:arylsulfatase A-like enzyme
MEKTINQMNRRQFVMTSAAATAAIALSPALSACTTRRKKPNIVYILTDQWRASATGYAGDPNVRTPNLDRLAQESYNFRNAVSVCPVSTPYRASLLTGRYPTSTGMFLNDLHLPPTECCIGEALAEAGYKTAYIGKWHLDGHGRQVYIPPERRRGFKYWKVAECDHNYNHSHYYAGDSPEKLYWDGYDVYAQTKDAQQYITDQAESSEPFALFVSYGTPHFPHHTAPVELQALYPPVDIRLPVNVPESMKEQATIEAQGYYAHCQALDKSIQDILITLDEKGLRENTIFVFTSDHGEMLGSHGIRPKEKQVPLNESAGVPFLLRYPAIHGNTGKLVDMPINTPDIFPTLFGLAGLEIPETIEGDDLSFVIKGEPESEDHAVLYMQVAPWVGGEYGKEYRAVKTNRYTYVRALECPWLLFDDVNDPFQMTNLVSKPEYADILTHLDNQLKKLLERVNDDFRPGKSYIDDWGLDPNENGWIPYTMTGERVKVQTPIRKTRGI